jgi:hypothetical protein
MFVKCLVSMSFVVHGETLVIMRQSLAWQLFIFNSHKTSQCVETFVITMLHCSKSNGQLNLKLEERYHHLSLASCEHTQIMIPTFTFREKNNLCSQFDPQVQPPNKNHLGIKAFTICSQPTYLTNWKNK